MERKFCGGFQCASGGVPKEGDVDFCFRAHRSLLWVTMGHMSHHNLPYQNDPFRDVTDSENWSFKPKINVNSHQRPPIRQLAFRLLDRGHTHPGVYHRRLRVRRLAFHLPDHRGMHCIASLLQPAPQPKTYPRRLQIWQLAFRLPSHGCTHPAAPLLLPLLS